MNPEHYNRAMHPIPGLNLGLNTSNQKSPLILGVDYDQLLTDNGLNGTKGGKNDVNREDIFNFTGILNKSLRPKNSQNWHT